MYRTEPILLRSNFTKNTTVRIKSYDWWNKREKKVKKKKFKKKLWYTDTLAGSMFSPNNNSKLNRCSEQFKPKKFWTVEFWKFHGKIFGFEWF